MRWKPASSNVSLLLQLHRKCCNVITFDCIYSSQRQPISIELSLSQCCQHHLKEWFDSISKWCTFPNFSKELITILHVFQLLTYKSSWNQSLKKNYLVHQLAMSQSLNKWIWIKRKYYTLILWNDHIFIWLLIVLNREIIDRYCRSVNDINKQ